jgi:hypothetical protein
MSADNQQERLISIGWMVGFVDGEGCFSIGFVHQGDRKDRKGYKIGYQVAHEFAVTQGESSLNCLHDLKVFFKVGMVVVNKRHDNHKEHLYRYVVRKREDLLNVIIPFFRKYPMRSKKQVDFEKFSKCVELVNEGEHFSCAGLTKIAKITQTMNRKKDRSCLIKILNDHTRNTALF